MLQVIRHYHGHLSGVYSLALHPNLDLLMTGGRDSVCRVWDMRSKVQAHVLSGHDDTVCSILSQASDPQVTIAAAKRCSYGTIGARWCCCKGRTVLYCGLPPCEASCLCCRRHACLSLFPHLLSSMLICVVKDKTALNVTLSSSLSCCLHSGLHHGFLTAYVG